MCMCVYSNASDTANCLAILASVVHSQWGLVGGMVTTVHAYTPTLKIVDGPNTRNWRDGRAAANNVIPVPSTAAAAVATIIPGLGGYLIIVICIIISVLWSDSLYMYYHTRVCCRKLMGTGFRVPIASVSVLDLTCSLSKPVSTRALDFICLVDTMW